MIESVDFTAALDNAQGKDGQVILKVGYSGKDALRTLVTMCGQQVDVTIAGKQEVIAIDGDTGEVIEGQTSIYDGEGEPTDGAEAADGDQCVGAEGAGQDDTETITADAEGTPDDFEGAVITIDDYPIADIDAGDVRTTETVYHDVPVPPRDTDGGE